MVGIGLQHHAPDAAEGVEVVDVDRAQVGLQRLEQVGQRHALRLGFGAVHLDFELRDVGLVAADRIGHARRFGDLGLEGLQRLLQRRVAQARAILQEQRVARAVAQALDGRRHQRVGEAALDLRELGAQLGIDLLGAARALAEGLEHDVGAGQVGRGRGLQRIEAREGSDFVHALHAVGQLHDLARHLGGAAQRGALGQLGAAEQVQLVLQRDEAARHGLEQHGRARQQRRVDRKHQAAAAQRLPHGVLVAVRAAVEEAVEGPEEPAQAAVQPARQQIARRAARLQQLGRQCRRQRQRVDGRDHRGDGDRHGELLVELARHAAEEGHGHEDRAQHQGDGDDGARDLLHRQVRRLQGRVALLDVALHVLHHDDGIVHHDADGQHQSEQGQRVDGVAQQVQPREGSDDGHGHGQQRNDGSTPGLQEDDDHQHHEDHRLDQRALHRLDGVAHEDRGVPDGLEVHAFGQIPGQALHGGIDLPRHAQRIGARRQEDAHGRHLPRVAERAHAVVAGAQFDARHVGQAHDLAVGTPLEHDGAELLGRLQAAAHIDGQQLVRALGAGLGAQLAGRYLHVLLTDGGDHLGGGELACGHLAGIQPDAHRIVACAVQRHLADAGDARQLVLDLERGMVAQVQRIMVAVAGGQARIHQRRGRALLRGHAVLAHFLGKAALRLAHAVLHAHGCRVGVHVGAEGGHHLQAAVRGRDRLQVDQAFDAIDRLLQRHGHRLGDLLGIGARIGGAHHHAGRHDLGILAHGQLRNRNQAHGEQDDGEHDREDRAVYEEFGEIHGASRFTARPRPTPGPPPPAHRRAQAWG